MRNAVIIYTDTTSKVAVSDFMEHRRRGSQRMHERNRKYYFLAQRMVGAFLLALTAFAAQALDGDVTIAVFTVPMGIYLMVAKRRMIGI